MYINFTRTNGPSPTKLLSKGNSIFYSNEQQSPFPREDYSENALTTFKYLLQNHLLVALQSQQVCGKDRTGTVQSFIPTF